MVSLKSSSSYNTAVGQYLAQGTAWTSPTASFQTSQLVKIRSAVYQGTQLTIAPANVEFNGDIGQFDLTAGQSGIIVGLTTTGALIIYTSGSHYGGGNDANAWLWSIDAGCKITYLPGFPPTMNAGLGVLVDGHNVALSSLPYAINPFSGSGVVDNATAVGFTTHDSVGTTLTRSLTNTDGTVTIANPDGVAGNPVISATASASWALGAVRWYAVDGTHGSDANVGFSDVSSADAGTKAKQTIGGLAAIFPRIGGRPAGSRPGRAGHVHQSRWA